MDKQLVLGDAKYLDPDWTSQLEKGVRTYEEIELLEDGTAVGRYTFDGVSTQPTGSGPAWYGHEAFSISREGVIEGVSHGFPKAGNDGKGSIVGGTGSFAGASGEYRYADDLATITFRITLP